MENKSPAQCRLEELVNAQKAEKERKSFTKWMSWYHAPIPVSFLIFCMALGVLLAYRTFLNPHPNDGFLGGLVGFYLSCAFFAPVFIDWFSTRVRLQELEMDCAISVARYKVLYEQHYGFEQEP